MESLNLRRTDLSAQGVLELFTPPPFLAQGKQTEPLLSLEMLDLSGLPMSVPLMQGLVRYCGHSLEALALAACRVPLGFMEELQGLSKLQHLDLQRLKSPGQEWFVVSNMELQVGICHSSV